MNVSDRCNSMQASPIRKLMPYANDAKARGIKVYHLNIGQPDIQTPAQMLDAYHNFNEQVLAYGPSQGLPQYQQNLATYYQNNNINVQANDIIVTTAGSEAITFAMFACCEAGDEIIVPEPFYTNYNGFASLAGVKIVPLTTRAEDGFALPSEAAIEAVVTPRTKAIMYSNPGNPTGTVYSRQQLEVLAKIAAKHNLWLIADEVYREFVYDGLTYTSILHLDGVEDRAIIVDSVSKRYSACGARVGCIVSKNKQLMGAVLKLAQARLCPPTIDQIAADACTGLGDDYFTPIITEYDRRRNIVFDHLSEIDGVVCRKPGGAFYIIAQLPIDDCEDFAMFMLKDFSVDNQSVMFAPAEGFYATPGLGRNELRLAYILNEHDLNTAMTIFKAGLKAYLSR